MIKQLLHSKYFKQYITTLETITHQPNHLAELEHNQHIAWQKALAQLGVSPRADATAIQQAIQERIADLATIICDVCDRAPLAQLVSLVTPHLPANTLNCYALKETVLIDMLQRQPPEGTLIYLEYASITECLLHESVYEIMAALRFSESAEWMKRFLQQYHNLTAADFEYRPMQFLTLAPEKWWKLAAPFATKKKHHFSHLKEAGVVFWYPSSDDAVQDHGTFVLMMLLHYIFEVQFYSSWFAHNASILPHFGEAFVHTLQGDGDLCASDQYHLPIIQQYHLKNTLGKPHPDPCAFEPHVMPEALYWRKAMETFFAVIRSHPKYDRVSFWESCYTIGEQVDGQLVTLNVVDNLLSTTVQFNYHWREDLWNAVFAHYFSAATLEKNIIHYFAVKQIDLNHIV